VQCCDGPELRVKHLRRDVLPCGDSTRVPCWNGGPPRSQPCPPPRRQCHRQ
jgi:hypothetical protein